MAEETAGQQLLVVDADDRFGGRYVARGVAHTDPGQRHRAFVCLAVDPSGQALLQRRRHWLWDGLWDFSAVSHVLHRPEGDETYEQAAARALREEMGLSADRFERVGGFAYYARHPSGDGCENEYCAIMVAAVSAPPTPNPQHVHEHRWLALAELRTEVESGPDRFTPWAVRAVHTLIEGGRWPPVMEVRLGRD